MIQVFEGKDRKMYNKIIKSKRIVVVQMVLLISISIIISSYFIRLLIKTTRGNITEDLSKVESSEYIYDRIVYINIDETKRIKFIISDDYIGKVTLKMLNGLAKDYPEQETITIGNNK
jgi:hypothetical protein